MLEGPGRGSQRQVGICFLFIGSQGVSRPCSQSWREGGRPGVLAASQPQAWPPGTAETPPPSPLNKHPVLSQDGALGVKEQMWKGRGRSTGRDPFPPQNPTDCILVSCVTEVSLLAPHCPPHSP